MTKKVFGVSLLFVVLLLVGFATLAQHAPPQGHPHDPLSMHFFPPELIMQHQQAIGLNDEQRNVIKGEIQKAQTRFTELQWQLQKEVEAMVSLVKEPKAGEEQVLTQLDKVLALEREIKRTHVLLCLKIKNNLSPEQQARLHELMKGMHGKD